MHNEWLETYRHQEGLVLEETTRSHCHALNSQTSLRTQRLQKKVFLSEKSGRTIVMFEGKKTTVGHRYIDHLPNPSALPVHQCSQHTECTHQAPPRKIRHEVVGPRRHGIRRTKGRQETRHCDVIDVMPGCGCHWSILPISSDACDDWRRWRGGGAVSCSPEP